MQENQNQLTEKIEEVMSKVKILPMNIEGEDKENYLKVKAFFIETRERIKMQIDQLDRQFKLAFKPAIEILKIAKKHTKDEALLKHIAEKEKFHKERGYDEESYKKERAKRVSYLEEFEKLFNKMFVEKIENGVAIVPVEIVNFCNFQAMYLKLDEKWQAM